MSEYFTAVWLAIQGKILVLALITALDLIFGVIKSLVFKEFEWENLMHYIHSDILPIFGWVAVVMITLVPEVLLPVGYEIPVVADVVYATVFVSILGSLFQSFAELGILRDLFSKIGIKDWRTADYDQ